MRRSLLMFAAILGCFATLPAQPQDAGVTDFASADAVVGKVTSISKDSLVIEPLMGGNPLTVKLAANTRVSKDRQPIKREEIKSGDVVFARGELVSGVIQARAVSVVDPQMIERMQQGGAGGAFGTGRGRGAEAGFSREDWGKKFIAGEVKAINETRLTIARPDGESLEVEVDENTSFKRGNESITLPEIKVGDFVRGPGEIKNNIFVAKELRVGRPQMRMMTGAESAVHNPPPDKPSTPAPPKN